MGKIKHRPLDESEWWGWFEKSLAELAPPVTEFAAEARLWDALAERQCDLAVEVEDLDRTRRVVFSGVGQEHLFAEIESLVKAAPDLPAFTFVALHPAEGAQDSEVPYGLAGDKRDVEPERMSFTTLHDASNPLALGIRVFLPGGLNNLEWGVALQWIFMRWFGERMVGAIYHLEAAPLEQRSAHVLPIVELPRFIDGLTKKKPPLSS